MNLTPHLQTLGLSKNEAKVYIELLKLGQTNVGPVVSKTRLHRQLVYEALNKLVDKKLTSFVIKNNRKYFQAAPPVNILKLIEKKEELAKQILPELSKLQINSIDKIEIHTLYGQKGFFDNLAEVINSAHDTDGIIRIIGGAKDTDFYRTIGEKYPDYVKLLEKKKVKKYLIAPDSSSEEFKQKFVTEKGSVLKTLVFGLSAPTYTRITQEMVSIEIYASDVTVIQIKNKAIAKGYLEHFQLLWGQADTYRA
ncbi:MAG: hypothetical protein COX81_03970 [Candidatus Magasanikbacteria bacterium CG_4_10_14_0_2_um_filter_37_12]|uniref:Transcription regulator TrmB N-terminal domain-containing protein n=1 Tax=Candidatus Magasanikbacteria bacterium CG_4_10_14_0_2_um_filter_37_12 TaxID=1974637 RepID=A0A2M7V6K2_9BACT|nr:MAG: hypothetical protein COX81_03970 [Candidatus Magasanikbacteria bacterium CG_4_10_14_0_2_um_filter_37_12]